MGLMDKFKNLFTEEEEIEEEPIKKEVIHVDIPAPASSNKKKEEPAVTNKPESNDFTPTVHENREDKFKFPVYFDDKDFDDLEKDKPIVQETKPKRTDYKKTREEKKEPYSGVRKTVKEEKKEFRPSPIISPVYGILDKNYHKEDITAKRPNSIYTSSKSVTVDDIRNKAFGTLEDDLENTMFGQKSILFNDKEEKDSKKDDYFDDLGFGLDERFKDDSKNEESMDDFDVDLNALKEENLTLDELNKMEENGQDNNKPKTRSEKNKVKDDDLFNLIDSMYEKRDDE